MLSMDISGKAITNPANVGFRPANPEANAIIIPDKIVLTKNHVDITLLNVHKYRHTPHVGTHRKSHHLIQSENWQV